MLGTWRSDRRRTVAEWRFAKRPTPRLRRFVFGIFGKLRVTYTRTRIRSVYGNFKFTQPYKVLATDSDTVAILHHDRQLTGKWLIQHIHFDGSDRFWIALGRNREWFKKVKNKAD